MKSFNYVAGFMIIYCLILSGCKREQLGNATQNSQINGVIISNNQAALNNRVTISNKRLQVNTSINQPVSATRIKSPAFNVAPNYVFTIRAQVAPPIYNGDTLQATHVKIFGNYAFVTYNTAGTVYLGGLEIFDVSDISNPKIVWQAVFPHTDISSVDYYNNKVYLAGATDLNYAPKYLKTPAMLEVLSLDANYNITKVDTTIDLSSYVGTDVKVAANGIYTTSGSNGFLKVYNFNYKILDSLSLDNARSIGLNSQYVYVFQGQPGRLNVYNQSNNSYVTTYNVGGANQDGAESDIGVSDKYIFTALNEAGAEMLNLDGSVKQSFAKPPTPAGAIANDYVTNSVTINQDLVLFGNGEAGLYVGGIIESKNDSVAIIGSIDFGPGISANYVTSNDSIIFVATGLGGLKIISLSIDNGLPPVIISTKVCPTLLDSLNSMFPEGVNNMVIHPILFSSSVTKELVLSKPSNVYVTFLTDGALWNNTLGYYTYNQNNPPTSVSSITQTVLFPNASSLGNGGGLVTGNMVQVGTGEFPAGTVIGFYLVSMGWQNGVLVPGRYTNYTDTKLNVNNNQQSTLFVEQGCNDIIMTWEDTSQSDTYYITDDDFNDLMFIISDNENPASVPSTSFNLSNVPKL